MRQIKLNQTYDRPECVKDATALRQAIAPYPVQLLGTWSFVLVPADDWKTLVRAQGGDPVSPAFSMLDQRLTLLDTSLFVASASRNKELLERFGKYGPALVDFKVSEGHNFWCNSSRDTSLPYGQRQYVRAQY